MRKKYSGLLYVLAIVLLIAFVFFGVSWVEGEHSGVPALVSIVACFACIFGGMYYGRSR